MNETRFKEKIINRVREYYPDAIVMSTNGVITGIPDYVVFTGEGTFFIEAKTKTKLSLAQECRINKLKKMGYPVYCINPSNFNIFENENIAEKV